MVTFYTTDTGKNVIDMGEHGMLVFSDMTKTKLGYRWLTYSKKYVEKIPLKMTDGSREYREVSQRESHVFNLKMKRDSEGLRGVPNGTIPRKLANWIAKTLTDLSPDGEHFPYQNIEKLKSKIEKTNFNTMIKKKKKRKKLTKKEKANQEKSLAILARSVDDKKGS